MKKKRKIGITVIIVILLAVMGVSSFFICRDFVQGSNEKKEFSALQELINEDSKSERNLKPLFEQNRDFIGWISIPDTTVDYPVMHTPSNPQKYLRLSFSGEYSRAGVPFLDSRCSAESDNLIIYGHNMKNDTMFSSLTGYMNKAYCDEHPYIEFETKSGSRIYQIFAVAQISETDDWYNFLDAANQNVFNEQISYISDKSLYITEITPKFNQQIVTLSTCYGDDKSDRLIILGVHTEDN